jgi:Vitamin K-dependent gamma-carboxylase
MTESSEQTRWRLSDAIGAWRTFWFRPEPAYPLGLIRMAFGVLVIIWAFTFLSDMYTLLGQGGTAPRQPSFPYHWGIFAVWPSNTALMIGWVVLLLAAVALTAGWHSRLAALIVFVLVVSFIQRNPFLWNSGDVIIRILSLFVALSPCGAALSLDQRRSEGRFWSAQVRPNWPIRLIQLQFCIIYLSTAQAKLNGTTWLDGTAVSYVMRNEDYVLVAPPHSFTVNLLLVNAITWGTLIIEIALGLLVWNRRLRPWILLAGIVMHLFIFVGMAVGLFSLAMFVLYLAWVPPDVAEHLPESIRRGIRTTRDVVFPRGPSPDVQRSQEEPEMQVVEKPSDTAGNERELTSINGEPLRNEDRAHQRLESQ